MLFQQSYYCLCVYKRITRDNNRENKMVGGHIENWFYVTDINQNTNEGTVYLYTKQVTNN